MRRRMRNVTLLFVTLCALIGAPWSARAGEEVRLYLGASPVGGGWYPTMGLIAEVIKENIPGVVTTVGTEGGRANAALVGAGRADLAFSVSPLVRAAYDGRAPYDKAFKNIRSLYRFEQDSPTHLIVLKDTGVTSMEMIAEKKIPIKVATDQPGSTGYALLQNLLPMYGMSFDAIKGWGGKVFSVPRGEVVSLIRDGHANAYFAGLTPPTAAVTELSTVKDLVFLSNRDEIIQKAEALGYQRSILRKGTYPKLEQDVQVVGEVPITIVRAELPDDLVYKITKALVEKGKKVQDFKPGKFNVKEMAKNLPVPLHPGAERYYREAGLL